jgi:hypothetical protein
MSALVKAFQQSLYEALSTHAGVLVSLGSAAIYDGAPRGIEHPFIAFDTLRAEDWSSGDWQGVSMTVDLNLRTRDAGRKSLQLLCEEVKDALSTMPQDLGDAHMTLLNILSTRFETARDGEGYQCIMRLNALLEAV